MLYMLDCDAAAGFVQAPRSLQHIGRLAIQQPPPPAPPSADAGLRAVPGVAVSGVAVSGVAVSSVAAPAASSSPGTSAAQAPQTGPTQPGSEAATRTHSQFMEAALEQQMDFLQAHVSALRHNRHERVTSQGAAAGALPSSALVRPPACPAVQGKGCLALRAQ